MLGTAPQPRQPVLNALRSWLVRHQHPFNFWVHMLGIPLAFGGLLWLAIEWEEWWWGVGGLVLGYFLQWLGHRVEGNDVGEWAGIKRMVGLPYVSISPRWQGKADGQTAGMMAHGGDNGARRG